MKTNVLLQKISWLCCWSWDRHNAGHSSSNPLFKECRPTGFWELSLVFSCCVPLLSGVVIKHFNLQILTHYGSCERSDSNLFRASLTMQVWSSGAHWRSSPLTGDAQHPFLNSEYELPDPPGQAALGQALTSVEGRWKLLPCSELVLSILIWSTSFSPFQSTAITSFPVGTHLVRPPNATTICSISLKPTQLSKQENHRV